MKTKTDQKDSHRGTETRRGEKNLFLGLLLLLLIFLSQGAQAQTKTQTVEAHDHSYVPLREVEMEIRDFSFPTLAGKTLRLSEAAKGKKLILVHYFAAWCHNSNFDVKTMTDLYLRYFDQGLLVIGVCEYSKNDELREFIERHRPTYPICIEGDGKKKDRTGTTHYFYRSKVDDQRTWGTPLNILISAEDLLNEGEIVAKKVRVAPGEVIPTEFEDLIREKLSKK